MVMKKLKIFKDSFRNFTYEDSNQIPFDLLSGDLPLREIGITLWFDLRTAADLIFSEKFVNFRLALVFKSWCFYYDNDETRTQNTLVSIYKPKQYWHIQGLLDTSILTWASKLSAELKNNRNETNISYLMKFLIRERLNAVVSARS